MQIWKPSEAELYDAGTLKWSGVTTDDGEPTLGAWVAEMDFGTSPAVAGRLVEAIHLGFLGYTPPWADAAVHQALVQLQDRRYGWAIKEGWVRTSPSVLATLRLTIAELTRPGSAVIVPTPAYMPFLTIPQEFGREVIQVPSLHDPDGQDPEDAWSLDLAGIEAALEQGAGLVVLCNPWNPTGRALTIPELRALHEVVSGYDALVFSDEIHAPLVLADGGSHYSYARLSPEAAAHTVTAVAASKAWNVAGLQCAQVILPDAGLRDRYDAAPKAGFGHAGTLGVLAATPAYLESDAWLAEVISQINTNLDLLDAALEGTPVDYTRPQATYLTWIGFDNVPAIDDPARVLREDFHVAVNDGTTLGSGYEKWVRVNAAMSPEPWKKVVAALAQLAKRA